jgi:hypothetical protein
MSLFHKGAKNHPRKPHKTNGRISPIRPFHKVHLLKQDNIQTDRRHRTSSSFRLFSTNARQV